MVQKAVKYYRVIHIRANAVSRLSKRKRPEQLATNPENTNVEINIVCKASTLKNIRNPNNRCMLLQDRWEYHNSRTVSTIFVRAWHSSKIQRYQPISTFRAIGYTYYSRYLHPGTRSIPELHRSVSQSQQSSSSLGSQAPHWWQVLFTVSTSLENLGCWQCQCFSMAEWDLTCQCQRYSLFIIILHHLTQL